MYVVSGNRVGWEPQTIDLSWWAGQPNVPVKFRLNRWNNEQADGWYLDDVTVTEQVPIGLSYPFFDSFERGLGNWMPASWHTITSSPYDGTNSVFSLVTDDSYVNRQYPFLSLAGWIDLTNAVNPQLVFYFQGVSCSDFLVQVATPGSGFSTVWHDSYCGNYGWTRAQLSLNAYVNQKIRLAFYAPNRGIYIDKIGVGGIMPGAPGLADPPEAGLATALRPTLTVTNAVHAENFALTYQFEVYSDAALSQLVAQVPLVASGAQRTSWPLDINLADNARYWWHCRAFYGTNVGPWMPTATFYVNSSGLPPLQVILAAPTHQAVIENTNTLLSWYAGVDPAGDYIQVYDLQVDDSPAFDSPTVNGTLAMTGPVDPLSNVTISVPLGVYAGAENLHPGIPYYWRVRAQDAHGMLGPWSTEPWFFELAETSPTRATITSFQTINGTDWLIQWNGPTGNVYLEATPDLNSVWSTIAGPLSGTSHIFQKPADWTTGFYRLRSE